MIGTGENSQFGDIFRMMQAEEVSHIFLFIFFKDASSSED